MVRNARLKKLTDSIVHADLPERRTSMHKTVNQSVIELVEGDITEMDTEAIVNAANTALQLGAGVAGAIRSKGGPRIQEECNQLGGTYVGGAVITTGGDLMARYVIHAVGPQMGEGNEDQKLENAAKNSLITADRRGLKSIAFPAISTGIYGFPIDRCARIMVSATAEYLRGETGIERVVFCLFGKESYKAFEKELSHL
jgi:O-acetyl-ADP-ribose deacetylase (regulator of RNase III)